MSKRRSWAKWTQAGVASLLLTGCDGGFFIDTKSITASVPSTGDYVYAANPVSNTLNEYVVGPATLTLVSGSPLTMPNGLAGASVAVSRSNTYVYVGGVGGIACYSIGAGGALSYLAANLVAAAGANLVSLDTSADGKWLLAADSVTQSIYVYGINTSNGVLSLNGSFPYNAPGSGAASTTAKVLRISPNNGLIAVSLGAGGDAVGTFNTSTGVASFSGNGAVAPGGYVDTSVLFDANSAYLYVARVGPSSGLSNITSLAVNSSGALSGGSSIATGNSPRGLLLDATGTFLYSANTGDATVSGFTVSKGSLSGLAGSPFTSAGSPVYLAEDNSKKYVIAAGSAGGQDMTLFSFDALVSGKLDAVAAISTGSAGVSAVAATH